MNITYKLSDLPHIAQIIIKKASTRIVLFDAAMGMGKTTLIKQLCKSLGSTDTITSPTFALVNEYVGTNSKIFHFDLYRLDDEKEAIAIGFEEYLDQEAWVFIEWPEKVKRLLPDQVTTIKIEQVDVDTRLLFLQNS